jgi:hypothetical protein
VTRTLTPLTLRIALLVLFLTGMANAQSPGYLTPSNTTGMPDYGSFITSQIDSINLQNGGLSLRIPLLSRKGRGFD